MKLPDLYISKVGPHQKERKIFGTSPRQDNHGYHQLTTINFILENVSLLDCLSFV